MEGTLTKIKLKTEIETIELMAYTLCQTKGEVDSSSKDRRAAADFLTRLGIRFKKISLGKEPSKKHLLSLHYHEAVILENFLRKMMPVLGNAERNSLQRIADDLNQKTA